MSGMPAEPVVSTADCVTGVPLQNFYQDIHDIAHTEGTSTKVVHDRAEVFDIKTEALFRYLQVLPLEASRVWPTACCCHFDTILHPTVPADGEGSDYFRAVDPLH